MIIKKYFPRRLEMKVNWTWNRFKCRKLVKIWSFGFEVWLEIESILFGSYRSQDLTNTIDKNWFIFDRNEMWWLWMATSHCPLSLRLKRAFGNQWKIRKKSFSYSLQPFQFNFIKPDAVLEFEPFAWNFSMKISSFRYRKSRISKEISKDPQ